ncbi:MAG: hypothetical protein V4643_02005 [Bacteroidota bacterium]
MENNNTTEQNASEAYWNKQQIILPKIYSKQVIVFFSVFFSAIFGAVLLMQNLKDAGKRSEANKVLFYAILYTVLTIFIVNIPAKPQTALSFICNFAGGIVLGEVFFKKHFPNEEAYEKKTIWKPLFISFLILVPFVLAMIYSIDEMAK